MNGTTPSPPAPWINAAERAGLRASLGELCGHDDATVAELIESIFSANVQDLDTLRGALARGDGPGAAAIAHRLMSVSGMLALSTLSAACSQFEHRAQSALDAETAAQGQRLYDAFSELNILLRGARETPAP